MTRDIRRVKTLLGHKNLEFSIECLKSFINNSYDEIHLFIYEDGSITRLDEQKLVSGLKNVVIISKKERDIKVKELLSKYPNCNNYRNITNYAQKLFDVMIDDADDLLFIDSDVFFLKKFKLPKADGVPIFMKDTEHAYSFNPIEFLKISNPIYPRINSGFFYFPKALFDLNYIEELLGNSTISQSFKNCLSWSEQTIWAFLAAKHSSVNYFDWRQIVMAEERLNINERVIAVHLVSTFRGHFEEVKNKTSYDKNVSFEEIRLIKGIKYLNKGEFALQKLVKRAKRQFKYF